MGGALVELVVASFDGEGLCVDECVGDFFVGGCEYSPEGLPGDIHFLCGLGVVEALKVGKADCFELTNGEGDMLEDGQGDSPGFIVAASRQAANPSAISWSRHSFFRFATLIL